MFAGMFPASVFGSYEPTVMRFVAKAAMSADNDSLIAKSDTLGEITVMAAPVTRYDDHLLLYPTKEQRRHASNGFDVMKNMMIPGVDVDAKGGSISAFGAKATIYVNGLPADVNDIRMMRPKDIERIEYYDVPTGKYSRDKLAVNFVAKEYRYGGYVMADASQTIGFNSGNYNASAMNILEELPVSGKRDYLLAVVHSRNGNEKKAVEYFLSAVNQERSLRFRGNLDPEISRLIDKYKIQAENL